MYQESTRMEMYELRKTVFSIKLFETFEMKPRLGSSV